MMLKDRVAIVTGASSGIGRGIAIELAREGARVVIADLTEAPRRGRHFDRDLATPTAEAIAAFGGVARYIPTDVTDDDQLRRLVEQTVASFAGLDILVNNAGIHVRGDADELAIADWDRVVSVDLRAVFVATKLSIPHLRRSPHGRVIQIASVHACSGRAGPAYGPAKAAIVNMVRSLAIELGPDGITANAICPGAIETPIQDYLTEEQLEAFRNQTPLRRFGTPRDIGRAVVFIASDDAAWMTGTAMVVDGGLMAGGM